MKKLATIPFLTGAFPSYGFAQSDDHLAGFTILVPKDGMQKQLVDDYKLYLQCYVNNDDETRK